MIFNLHFVTLIIGADPPPKIKKDTNSSDLNVSAECKKQPQKEIL
jgi:hypothetical protein